ELPGAHAANVGVGSQPRLINAVHQVVVVIFGKSQFRAEQHLEAHLVAPLFGGAVAGEIVVYDLIPIVVCVNPGEVLRVEMVRHNQSGEAMAHIAVHHLRRRQVAALAGFRRVSVGVKQVSVHKMPSFHDSDCHAQTAGGGQRLGTGQTKAGFSTKKSSKMQTFSILRRNSARKKEKYTSALKYIEFCQKSQYKTAISGLLVKMA
ncbi:Sigma-24, partial [Dysosmobacter welbionis]